MSRMLQLVLGPEVYWLGIYAASRLVAGALPRRDPTANLVLEWSCWLLPVVAVPLSFALFYWVAPAPTSRAWITARLMLATLIGLNAALFAIIDGIDYGDSRNSGVLGFWMIGLLVGGALWLVGYATVAITGVHGEVG